MTASLAPLPEDLQRLYEKVRDEILRKRRAWAKQGLPPDEIYHRVSSVLVGQLGSLMFDMAQTPEDAKALFDHSLAQWRAGFEQGLAMATTPTTSRNIH